MLKIVISLMTTLNKMKLMIQLLALLAFLFLLISAVANSNCNFLFLNNLQKGKTLLQR